MALSRTKYTNMDLAHDYMLETVTNKMNIRVYKRISRIIEEAKEDIPQFYLDRGSLDGLKIPGIGSDTILKLGPILKKKYDL